MDREIYLSYDSFFLERDSHGILFIMGVALLRNLFWNNTFL